MSYTNRRPASDHNLEETPQKSSDKSVEIIYKRTMIGAGETTGMDYEDREALMQRTRAAVERLRTDSSTHQR